MPDPGPRIVPAHFRAVPKSVLHTPKALDERMTIELVKGKIRRHKQGLDKLQDGQTILPTHPHGNSGTRFTPTQVGNT